MEIKITINGLDQLTEALALIGSALTYQKGMVNTAEAAANLITEVTTVNLAAEPMARYQQPILVQQPASIQQPTPIQQPAPQSVPVQQPQIEQPQMQGVPVQAQTYSMEQLAVAATQLVDAGRRTELVGLLQQFGVQALTALPKEQYGNFATQLRSMGAKI